MAPCEKTDQSYNGSKPLQVLLPSSTRLTYYVPTATDVVKANWMQVIQWFDFVAHLKHKDKG